jgi:hypothetical protein
MHKNKIILHIGFPKTGTTTLQKHYFPFLAKSGSYHFLGRHNPAEPKNPICFTFHEIINQFSGFEGNFKKHHNYLHQSIKCGLGLPVIWSDEGISMTFHGISIDRDYRTTAWRLRSLLADFDVKVLICLREQYKALFSLYVQMYSDFQVFPNQSTFDRFLRHQLSAHPSRVSAGYKYGEVIGLYKNLFGSENILPLLFEQFCRDDPDTLSKFASFIEAEIPTEGIFKLHHENAKLKSGDSYWTEEKTARRHYGDTLLARALTNPFVYHAIQKCYKSKATIKGIFRKLILQSLAYQQHMNPVEISSSNPDLRDELRMLFAQDNASLQTQYGLALLENGYALEKQKNHNDIR